MHDQPFHLFQGFLHVSAGDAQRQNHPETTVRLTQSRWINGFGSLEGDGIEIDFTAGFGPAPTDVPGIDDPHVNYSANTSSCTACHGAHTANGIVLRQTWSEEDLCFACHADSGPGTNVQSAFANTNTTTGFFRHDVAAVSGVHRVGQSEGADYGGGNRHVECEDCHEPHEATRGQASAPMLQREMNDTSGVDPMWATPGPPDPDRTATIITGGVAFESAVSHSQGRKEITDVYRSACVARLVTDETAVD